MAEALDNSNSFSSLEDSTSPGTPTASITGSPGPNATALSSSSSEGSSPPPTGPENRPESESNPTMMSSFEVPQYIFDSLAAKLSKEPLHNFTKDTGHLYANLFPSNEEIIEATEALFNATNLITSDQRAASQQWGEDGESLIHVKSIERMRNFRRFIDTSNMHSDVIDPYQAMSKEDMTLALRNQAANSVNVIINLEEKCQRNVLEAMQLTDPNTILHKVPVFKLVSFSTDICDSHQERKLSRSKHSNALPSILTDSSVAEDSTYAVDCLTFTNLWNCMNETVRPILETYSANLEFSAKNNTFAHITSVTAPALFPVPIVPAQFETSSPTVIIQPTPDKTRILKLAEIQAIVAEAYTTYLTKLTNFRQHNLLNYIKFLFRCSRIKTDSISLQTLITTSQRSSPPSRTMTSS